MSNIQNFINLKKDAIKTLKLLILIPNHYIRNENEYKFINSSISILTSFLELKTITSKDIKIVEDIISIADHEAIFNCYLYHSEKEFVEREYLKYLENPKTYTIPNLETFIDNGEFLKLYIEHKIGQYNEEQRNENQDNTNKLSKAI